EELNLNLGATELRLGPLPNHLLLLESGRRIAKEGGVEGGGSSSLKRNGSAAELSQVIGWPPVRNFRRQQLPRPAPQPTSTVSPPKPPATSGTPSQISLLVKVYMDGRPIGRKVNLTINNSYDKLKSAVEDMFQQYISDTGVSSSSCGQKLNLLHSSKYVLTYMDHEGDLMLVGGDVPWEDFTTNVQRLRITKGDDIG
ncbi:unnamed protein product, partial [Sphagnum troendelagicum]